MADDGSGAGLRGRDLLGLGGLLAGAVIVCTAIGYLVDDRTGRTPLFTLVGIGLGVLIGGIGFAIRVRAALRD